MGRDFYYSRLRARKAYQAKGDTCLVPDYLPTQYLFGYLGVRSVRAIPSGLKHWLAGLGWAGLGVCCAAEQGFVRTRQEKERCSRLNWE